ncbi:MAG: DUF1566 domain-containing protein [Rhodocyclaceae bacterium]|nr:DUF1566 domain-containing protein [Rhodocyclaceae bacterium]
MPLFLPARSRAIASVLALLGALCAAPAQAAPLNDTGITFCGAYPSGNTPAPCTPNPTGQDADYGRDAAAQAGVLPKLGGGSAGFDFTKIANDGSELPAGAALGPNPGDWACTRDNVTGRVWEVKLDDALQMRHQSHTYTWYDPASPDGNPGAVGTTGTCNATLGVSECNTANYVAAVNAAQLCGYTDWRMPTVKELEGIADRNRTNPAIDPDYFPNTPSWPFWSGSPYAGYSSYAWFVYFNDGHAGYDPRSLSNLVRLVRGGQ